METTSLVTRTNLTNLKCLFCQNYLTVPPIMIISVHGDQYKCGRCSFVDTELNIPAIMFETLASMMKFPCTYINCKKDVPWNAVKSHEEACIYQPIKCPCGETMELHEAHRHFVDMHPDIVSEDRVVVENPGLSQFHTRFLIKNEVPFLVYVLCEKKGDIKVGVYLLKNTSERYEFKLQLSTNSNTTNIVLPNQRVVKFKWSEHCSDCLLRTCGVMYHKYQNDNANQVTEITSARVNTSSVFKILDSEYIILSVTVIEKGHLAVLEVSYAKNEQLRKSWECQICQEYLTVPIYLCPTGHSLCGTCKGKLSICPYCILDIGDSRNFTLEEMAEHVQLTCQYENKGCGFVGNVEKMSKHERMCEYNNEEMLRKRTRLNSEAEDDFLE